MSSAEQPKYCNVEEYFALEEQALIIDLDEKMAAYLTIPSLECYIALEQHQPIAIVMRRSSSGFLRQMIQEIDQTVDLPFLGCSLPMREIYKRIEFTAECVLDPDPEYELTEWSIPRFFDLLQSLASSLREV